ncbi:MAG TPA: hypothetical protein DCR21_02095 [Succinivibrionaceae bacterium]|nr:GNAT family N-acetyltransferase [Succinivibrio sp.]HAR79598.1 hypothetical protein [Succinivibrionaceae bacterium]
MRSRKFTAESKKISASAPKAAEFEFSCKQIGVNDDLYSKIISLYETSFPEHERIPSQNIKDDPALKKVLFGYFVNKSLCGFSLHHEYKNIIGIWYIAVSPEMRGKGIGSKIIAFLKDRYHGFRISVDIEVDSPDAENYEERVNRRRFYENRGFISNGIISPWNHEFYESLSFNGAITEKELEKIWLD